MRSTTSRSVKGLGYALLVVEVDPTSAWASLAPFDLTDISP